VSYGQLPPPWLGDSMAHALSAMCPPLISADITRAAHRLAGHVAPACVVEDFLQAGADPVTARQIVEALDALRELAPAGVKWALAASPAEGSSEFALGEQVWNELVELLSRLTSPAGAHSILLRAMYLAQVDFPFVARLSANPATAAGFASWPAMAAEVGADQLRQGVTAVFRNALAIVRASIGGPLTARLMQAR